MNGRRATFPAQHIPRGNIEKSIARHIPEQTAGIIVYCAGRASRSAAVAEVLQRMGYTDVFSMAAKLAIPNRYQGMSRAKNQKESSIHVD